MEYRVTFYERPDGVVPVQDYIAGLGSKDKAKVLKYIDFLREHKGVLDEPYSKHIRGKVRELRVDFSSNRHRIFYFTFVNKNIILLHAFLKRTPKTPAREIAIATHNCENVQDNRKLYE